MSILSDLRVIWHLTMSPVRGKTHQERLESFYGGQAKDYDSFRKRLLRGREDMIQALPIADQDVWADLGGGTGANAEFFGETIDRLATGYVVDLCGPLLEVARQRFAASGWKHLETVEADATTVSFDQTPNLITFSYALTMIPDWYAAIDHAYDLLPPGGHIGVVDFFVSRKYVDEGRERHGYLTRTFWPAWFANDNVYLSRDHLPYLTRKFETVTLEERRAPVPYLPGFRVPYYLFIGRKP